MELRIPKRIFYAWGFGEPKTILANICIENWRMMLPEYKIIEINEKTPEWFDFNFEYNNNLWFKTVYDLKMWAYVSDYIRVKVLYDHGGIYFDTDVTVYKNLDKFLKNKMFIGNVRNNCPELAIIGAIKGHKYLHDLFEIYKEQIWKTPEYIITRLFKNILTNKYNCKFNKEEIFKNDDITIYTPEYFCPYHYGEEFSHINIKENTHACHWENSSWHNKKMLFFLSNKNKIPLKTLLKQLEFIEKIDRKTLNKTTINDLISVVIPSYNGEKYITECIKSIKEQNMNTEIIVVDDLSTDKTTEIARNMGCRVIINSSPKGQMAGKNTGIKEAKGKYWITIDQDDILNKGALKLFYEEFQKDKNTEIIMAKLKDFCSPDTPEEKNFCKKEPFNGILTGACMFKKEVFNKIGYFDESVKTGDVIDLTTRLNKTGIKIKKLDFISCARRIHNFNYGKTHKKEEYQDYTKLLRKRIKENERII